jgi:NAD(P) transhydrogenase
MEKKEFDFVVIGSGPAGQKGAIQASKSGFSVAVVEGFEMGGSSLWTGTIPSKALREAILDLTNFLTKSFYANEQKMSDLKDISISDLNHRVSWVKEHLKETIVRQLKKNKIALIRGFAKFVDPHTIEVYEEGKLIDCIRGKKFLLTPGSKPRMPERILGKGKRIFNSTDLLAVDVIPESIIVVGAGIIGTEYASMFSILGSKVTIVDKRARMLSFLDREIGSHLQIALEENNLRFVGEKEYESIKEIGNEVAVQFADGSEVRASTALVAAGRVANVEGLDLIRAGLKINPSGYIAVNEHYQTEVPHIFAAGDVIGGPGLSSTGYEQGRLAALNACGFPINRFDQIFPLGIYTIPEISCIGKTEEQLRKENVEYEVGRAYFYEVSKSVITGTESGLCKLIFDPKSLQLLGAHIIGREATELIHIAQLAISFNAKIDYFVEQVFNFPTFAEMYRIAALNGLNKLKR